MKKTANQMMNLIKEIHLASGESKDRLEDKYTDIYYEIEDKTLKRYVHYLIDYDIHNLWYSENLKTLEEWLLSAINK